PSERAFRSRERALRESLEIDRVVFDALVALRAWLGAPEWRIFRLWFQKIPSRRIRAAGAGGLVRLHREHRRAHGLARLQLSMRLRSLFKRIGLLDLDLDRAREHHPEEILCHRREIGTGGRVGV